MLNTGSLFWVVPAMFALFALAFGVVAVKEKEARSARWAALGFVAACFGSIIDTQRVFLPVSVSFFATPAHWVSVYALLQSMLARHNRTIPRLPLIIWATVSISYHISLFTSGASIPARIILMNTSVPILMLIALPALYACRRLAIDRILFWLAAGAIITYPLRLALFFTQDQAREVIGPWMWSQYIIVFYLVMAILGILTALALMLATGMDIVARHHVTSTTDALTGIGNRRFFDRCVEKDAERARLFGAALMIDLDRFKVLNDQHGHAAGDAVLVAVARELEAKLGSFCEIARIGGEEFAALVKVDNEQSATALSLIARQAVAAAIPASPHDKLRITASIGVATRQPVEQLRDTLKRADIALYHAKSAGRDRAMQVDSKDGLTTIRAIAA